MNRRPILILALALVCAVSAALLARQYLRSQLASTPATQAATALVAVAANDLPSGSVLRPEDVKMISWPGDARPASYSESPETVVGQGLLFPIKANEPILLSKLSGAAVGGLASVIPQGMRAVSVKVDEVIAVAGFVVPGTRVDVLVTMPSAAGGAGQSKVVLQNIKVLAAGQSFEPSAQGKPQDASVITLLVSPAEAEALTLATTEGRIQLALRNTLDEAVAVTRETRVEGQTPTPVTAPRSRASAVSQNMGNAVEIYHGSARTVTNF